MPHHSPSVATSPLPVAWLPSALWVPAQGDRRQVAVLVHGIWGSARNLRTLAVALVEAAPNWTILAVDLRNHGDSRAAPPPHTLDASADDVLRLCQHHGMQPRAVIGHSFGGKVAMALAQQHLPALKYLAVLDTLPHLRADQDASASSARQMVAILQTVPQPLAARTDVIAHLRHAGCSEQVCQWMTTNLEPGTDGYRWKFDLAGVDAMLNSYFATDSWPLLRDPPAALTIDVVRAGQSPLWTSEVLASFARLPPAVRLHVLPNAGHWLHVDDLDGVVAIVGHGLRQVSDG